MRHRTLLIRQYHSRATMDSHPIMGCLGEAALRKTRTLSRTGSSTTSHVAIWIYRTDAHLIIRNILASSGLGGIYLYGVQNAIIENVNVYDCDHAAIYMPGCKNVEVRDSYLSYCGHEGIAIDATWGTSSDITVTRNIIIGNEWTGINCDNFVQLTITDNEFRGNGFAPEPWIHQEPSYGAIVLVSVSDSLISGNWIEGNADGISIHRGVFMQSDNLTVIGNEVCFNEQIGIHLENCSGSRIYWNNIISNAIQAADHKSVTLELECNRWDGGTGQIGGNFWSDYVGPGPYKFETGLDRHPLAEAM